jgi:hypothetical protein
MPWVSMEQIDSDYAQYTRGDISRGELYKRWKKRHTIGLRQAIWRDLVLDLRSIRRDFKDLLGRSA